MIEKRQWIGKQGEIIKEGMKHFTDSMNEEGYRLPSHKLGARIFADVPFPEGMTPADIGYMTILSKHSLVGASNMLGYRQGKRIEAYTGSEIAEILGMSEITGKRFMVRMQTLKVIQKVVTNSGSQYYVNPAYFMRSGQRLSLDLYLLFREELNPLLPDWVIGSFLRQANSKAILASDARIEAERILKERHGH